jgi:hypothetical protein
LTETKQQFSEWKMKSKAKSMLIIFFDIKGIVHREFSLAGQNSQFRILLWRFTATAWKCAKTSPRTLATKEVVVASWQPTISFFTREFFSEKQHDCRHVPNSPHPPTWLGPPVTFLFPWLKIKLKGHNSDTMEVTEAELQAMLNTTSSAGNSAHAWKGTASRAMVASRPKVSFSPFRWQH